MQLLAEDAGELAWVALTVGSVFVATRADVAEHVTTAVPLAQMTPESTARVISLPVGSEGGPRGKRTLVVCLSDAVRFDEELATFLEVLAAEIASAVTRVELRVALVVEQTEGRRRSEELARERDLHGERARVLAEASRRIGVSLRVEETQAEIVRLAVPTLVDFVHLELALEPGPVDHPRYRVLTTGHTEIVEATLSFFDGIARDEEHRSLLTSLRIKTCMLVPLVSRRRVLGVLSFGSATRDFESDDIELFEELARRAAVAIENARLFELAETERRRAEEATRAKDEFLAMVSHELRTPLTMILGWTRMLRSNTLTVERSTQALATIERSAKVQTQLVEDLLDISRIVAGKLRLEMDKVDISEVVDAVTDGLFPAAESKEITLAKNLEAAVGTIFGDRDRLQQVIWNLLTNAVRHTPRGGRVEISLRKVDGRVLISVKDTGEGIAPDFLPHVFERFRQGESGTSRPHGGLGLGLAITKHIVELHGGTIRPESAGKGQGATFIVDVPVAPVRPVLASGKDRHASKVDERPRSH